MEQRQKEFLYDLWRKQKADGPPGHLAPYVPKQYFKDVENYEDLIDRKKKEFLVSEPKSDAVGLTKDGKIIAYKYREEKHDFEIVSRGDHI